MPIFGFDTLKEDLPAKAIAVKVRKSIVKKYD